MACQSQINRGGEIVGVVRRDVLLFRDTFPHRNPRDRWEFPRGRGGRCRCCWACLGEDGGALSTNGRSSPGMIGLTGKGTSIRLFLISSSWRAFWHSSSSSSTQCFHSLRSYFGVTAGMVGTPFEADPAGSGSDDYLANVPLCAWLFAHNAVPVGVLHELVGWVSAPDRCNVVGSGLGTGDSAIAVVVVHG